MNKIFIDARELEHPLPLQKAMEALKNLDDDRALFYMLHRKNPIPLLEIARGWELQVLSHEDENAHWHILITKNKDIDLSKYLDV